MPASYGRLGPGTLMLGGTADSADFSCQVLNCTLTSDSSLGDSTDVLCGDTIPGTLTDAATLDGTLLLDPMVGGTGEYTWTHHGETVEFEFVPDSSKALSVAGTLVVTRLSIGAGEYGALLESDFSWQVLDVTPTWATPAAP